MSHDLSEELTENRAPPLSPVLPPSSPPPSPVLPPSSPPLAQLPAQPPLLSQPPPLPPPPPQPLPQLPPPQPPPPPEYYLHPPLVPLTAPSLPTSLMTAANQSEGLRGTSSSLWGN
ncbi:hypothetical protein FHG87_022709 [Trinorchestia longiramus]|nr:hypothetical protein FHG87_022709 [Trinorchestia longiramus]